MTEAIKKAVNEYRDHVTGENACRQCASLTHSHLCPEGLRMSRAIGQAQGEMLLASTQKPAGGVQ